MSFQISNYFLDTLKKQPNKQRTSSGFLKTKLSKTINFLDDYSKKNSSQKQKTKLGLFIYWSDIIFRKKSILVDESSCSSVRPDDTKELQKANGKEISSCSTVRPDDSKELQKANGKEK